MSAYSKQRISTKQALQSKTANGLCAGCSRRTFAGQPQWEAARCWGRGPCILGHGLKTLAQHTHSAFFFRLFVLQQVVGRRAFDAFQQFFADVFASFVLGHVAALDGLENVGRVSRVPVAKAVLGAAGFGSCLACGHVNALTLTQADCAGAVPRTPTAPLCLVQRKVDLCKDGAWVARIQAGLLHELVAKAAAHIQLVW